MVEKSDHTGLWPSLYDPFRHFGTKLADWLNPATEASGNDDAYDISMELPGVSDDDIELTVEEGVVTIRGEKKTQHERKGDTWYFPNANTARSAVPSAYRTTRTHPRQTPV